ncbi:hypothetical protein Ga0074812_10828 [Parafrankia irregularis]|uniref:FoF1-type ATP synthase assembly protein I n=1 Tax=Parafrankia irregularis TaxID=795642 RepID=A0A0S4QMD9_9ACTN|nr:AtpZ/AtpI family protein [Parafrankia sp. CH37]CUU56500.1 hypothetical protein Ga0074812_10828 [Parafrankia irregularis]
MVSRRQSEVGAALDRSSARIRRNVAADSTNGRNRGHSGKKGSGEKDERLRSGPVDAGPPPGEAWGIIGTLVAGGGFWGLVGIGVDHLAGFGPVFFPIGLVVGMVASLYLVIYRFGARR